MYKNRQHPTSVECRLSCCPILLGRCRFCSFLKLLSYRHTAKLVSLLVRGTAEATLPVLEAQRPLFAEALPMTLEEVFIGEMEAVGYDYSNILS